MLSDIAPKKRTWDLETKRLTNFVVVLILKYREGEFKLYSRKDNNLNMVMSLGGETINWLIDVQNEIYPNLLSFQMVLLIYTYQMILKLCL